MYVCSYIELWIILWWCFDILYNNRVKESYRLLYVWCVYRLCKIYNKDGIGCIELKCFL